MLTHPVVEDFVWARNLRFTELLLATTCFSAPGKLVMFRCDWRSRDLEEYVYTRIALTYRGGNFPNPD